MGNEYANLPANLRRVLTEISDPPLDWRTLLWRYLTRTPSDFISYDRRFIGQELYLDAMDGESDRAAIYLTDGMGDFPEKEPNYPTLWVITPGGLASNQIPFGEVARMLN